MALAAIYGGTYLVNQAFLSQHRNLKRNEMCDIVEAAGSIASFDNTTTYFEALLTL